MTRKRSRPVRREAVGKVPSVGNSLAAYPTIKEESQPTAKPHYSIPKPVDILLSYPQGYPQILRLDLISLRKHDIM